MSGKHTMVFLDLEAGVEDRVIRDIGALREEGRIYHGASLGSCMLFWMERTSFAAIILFITICPCCGRQPAGNGTAGLSTHCISVRCSFRAIPIMLC